MTQRIGSSLSSSVAPLDGSVEAQGPVPAAPPGKPQPSQQVETFRGRPAGEAASSPWAGSPGTSFSVSDLAVMNGQLDALMHTKFGFLSGTMTTRDDAEQALQLLSCMDKKSLLAVLGEMKGSTFERLMSELGPEGRERFVELCVARGITKEEGGAPAGSSAGQPPGIPALVRTDKSLPAGLQAAIHEVNQSRVANYDRAYGEYLGRYGVLAGKTNNAFELRQLGPPVGQKAFGCDPGGTQTLHSKTVSQATVWKIISARMHEVNGEAPVGFTAKASLLVSGYMPGGAATVGGELLQNHVHGETMAGVGGRGGPMTLLAGRDAHGAPVLAATKDHLGGITLKGDVTEIEGMAGVPVGGFAELSPATGRFGAGLVAEHTWDAGAGVALGVNGKLGYDYQGVRPERAADIASREPGTLFGEFPELDARTPWAQIAPERRERMQRDGWNAAAWSVATGR